MEEPIEERMFTLTPNLVELLLSSIHFFYSTTYANSTMSVLLIQRMGAHADWLESVYKINNVISTPFTFHFRPRTQMWTCQTRWLKYPIGDNSLLPMHSTRSFARRRGWAWKRMKVNWPIDSERDVKPILSPKRYTQIPPVNIHARRFRFFFRSSYSFRQRELESDVMFFTERVFLPKLEM